jgi:hypothetical protein
MKHRAVCFGVILVTLRQTGLHLAKGRRLEIYASMWGQTQSNYTNTFISIFNPVLTLMLIFYINLIAENLSD